MSAICNTYVVFLFRFLFVFQVATLCLWFAVYWQRNAIRSPLLGLSVSRCYHPVLRCYSYLFFNPLWQGTDIFSLMHLQIEASLLWPLGSHPRHKHTSVKFSPDLKTILLDSCKCTFPFHSESSSSGSCKFHC